MELILKKKNADAFVTAMQGLAKKFDGVYLPGQIEEFVKLDVVNGKMQLTFDKVVPEMVRIACTMAFVETML